MFLIRFTKLLTVAGALAFTAYALQPNLEKVAALRDVMDMAMPIEWQGQDIRLQALASIPEQDFILYPANGTPQRRVTIFSDPTCPHCQAMHAEIPKLNASGWEVRLLLAPRGGPDSEYWPASRAIWCAPKRQAALDAYMAGDRDSSEQASPECDLSGLAAIVAMTEKLGIKKRPYLVIEDGTGIQGALLAENLNQIPFNHKNPTAPEL